MPAAIRALLLFGLGLWFGSPSHALPARSGETLRHVQLARRQNAGAIAAGLTDIDILTFALTLENLESAFYTEGFAKFPDQDFLAAGLTAEDIIDLKAIGTTEQTHVTTLTSAINGAGFQAVQPCTYNFGFTTAPAMLATAGILENIGTSAYLGAAPLIADRSILTVAAEITTVEARHQTFIRTASKAVAIPSAFDTPLGIRSVFSLAAPLIASCPQNSNLNIAAFTQLSRVPVAGEDPNRTPAGTKLALTTTAAGATNCAFSNGGVPGGTVYSGFVDGGCVVPEGLAGVTYLHLTSSVPAGNVLTDEVVVAGVVTITVS